jgi:phage protein D
MSDRAAYSISIDGKDVTDNFGPVLISMTIKDSDGGKSDTLELKLDDSDGQLMFPRVGADIEARLWRVSDGQAVVFKGKTDEPKSEGARGGGMVMSISAKSADMKGEGKHKKHAHKDGGKFKDTATEWGKDAGFTVLADDDIGGVERDYWSMSNESFFSWGQRMAEELGATFKVSGSNAAFVSRNSGSNTKGKALTTVLATYGDNIINWDMAPVQSRAEYQSSKVRWYDRKSATWKEEEVQISTDNND